MGGQLRPAPCPLPPRIQGHGAGLGPGVSGPGLAPLEPLRNSYLVRMVMLSFLKPVEYHTRTFPDNRRHLRLCFPLSISFLCTFLSSLESALIYHRFPLQSRLERRSVLKRICAIPGPSRTVGFTSVYAFLLAFLSSAHFFPLQGPPLYITDFLCSPDWRDEVY